MKLANAAVLALVVAAPAAAQVCHSRSDALTRPLVELYTSEGCSSCPPADRWLASRFPVGAEAGRPIALAFHVDYWDRLGWIDRFGSVRYTERQYAAMRANRATFVYTPQVLVQGRDVQGFGKRIDAALADAARMPARATITLDVAAAAATLGVDVKARISDAALRSDARLFVAYVDSGLHSDVRAGENRGVRLDHDRVVRSLQTFGPADGDGTIAAHANIKPPVEGGTAAALVAFVQRASNGDVLQTLSLPLDGCRGW